MVPTFSTRAWPCGGDEVAESLELRIGAVAKMKSKNPRLEIGSKSFIGSNGNALNMETLIGSVGQQRQRIAVGRRRDHRSGRADAASAAWFST